MWYLPYRASCSIRDVSLCARLFAQVLQVRAARPLHTRCHFQTNWTQCHEREDSISQEPFFILILIV